MKKVYLIGSDHVSPRYEWIKNLLEDISPNCITLEAKLDKAFSEELAVKEDLEKDINDHLKQGYLGFENAASIHHARLNKIPVYCIDIFHPFQIPLRVDITTNKLFKYKESTKIYDGNIIIRRKTFLFDSFNKSENDLTTRNKFMARGIDFQLKKHDSVAHIGGRHHFDEDKCIPIQKMISADYVEIYDSVNMKRIN